MILPNTDLAGARLVGERLRNEVAALAIPHAASSVCPTVSLSVGIAVTAPATTAAPQALIEAADRALYVSKARGRNTITYRGSAVNG